MVFASLTSFDVKKCFGSWVRLWSLRVVCFGRRSKNCCWLDLNKRFLFCSKLDKLFLADTQNLPFKYSSFDIVLMIEVLEHIPCEKLF